MLDLGLRGGFARPGANAYQPSPWGNSGQMLGNYIMNQGARLNGGIGMQGGFGFGLPGQPGGGADHRLFLGGFGQPGGSGGSVMGGGRPGDPTPNLGGAGASDRGFGGIPGGSPGPVPIGGIPPGIPGGQPGPVQSGLGSTDVTPVRPPAGMPGGVPGPVPMPPSPGMGMPGAMAMPIEPGGQVRKRRVRPTPPGGGAPGPVPVGGAGYGAPTNRFYSGGMGRM